MRSKSLILASIGIAAAMIPAAASPISTLFNTGVDGAGVVLLDGTIGDPHYTIASAPSGTTDIRVRAEAGGWPIPPYLGDNNLSRWVGPNNDQQLNGGAGTWDYRTTFSLAGGNPSTASIAGQFAADNEITDVLLNGHSLGLTLGTVGNPLGSSFDSWHAFAIGQYFVAGANTLDFLVYNDFGGNPTALRVEMTGNVTLPDGGSTVALMGLGLAGVAVIRRKLQA